MSHVPTLQRCYNINNISDIPPFVCKQGQRCKFTNCKKLHLVNTFPLEYCSHGVSHDDLRCSFVHSFGKFTDRLSQYEKQLNYDLVHRYNEIRHYHNMFYNIEDYPRDTVDRSSFPLRRSRSPRGRRNSSQEYTRRSSYQETRNHRRTTTEHITDAERTEIFLKNVFSEPSKLVDEVDSIPPPNLLLTSSGPQINPTREIQCGTGMSSIPIADINNMHTKDDIKDIGDFMKLLNTSIERAHSELNSIKETTGEIQRKITKDLLTVKESIDKLCNTVTAQDKKISDLIESINTNNMVMEKMYNILRAPMDRNVVCYNDNIL